MSPGLNLLQKQSHLGNAFSFTMQNAQTMNNKVVCTPFLRLKSNKTFGVYLNISANSERLKMYLGFAIEKKYWNENNKRITAKHPSAVDYNRNIDTIIQRINKIVSDANYEEIYLSISAIQKRLKIQFIKGDFISYMLTTSANRTDIKQSSKSNIEQTCVLLRGFKATIPVNELTTDLLKKFKSYLERNQYSANYIHNQIKNIKTYYNWLQDESDLKLPNIFSKVKTSWVRSSVTYCTINELNILKAHYEQIKNDKLIRPSYIIALRYYLFSCHTGLRISDINRLSQFTVVENVLKIRAKKQRLNREHDHSIPLSEYAQLIWTEIVQTQFTNISDQQKNSLVKEAAKNCNINKKLNFHTSRHTLATTLIKLKADLPTVQKMLDHSSIKTTMIYAHVVAQDLVDAVKLLNAM